MTCVRFIVQGWVQGVGYRAYVHRVAWDLGVVGEVWNTPDGRVAGYAMHSNLDSLERFKAHLWEGPGSVDSVELEEVDAPRVYTDFTITMTH
jgi:acylphosphatase